MAITLDTVRIEGNAGLEHWETDPAAWDRLYLGASSEPLPGRWEVSSGHCERDLDEKKTKDKDGARVRDAGAKAARFTVTGHMVSAQDWQTLQKVLPTLNPKKHGLHKSPLAIYHPAVAVLGIHTVYVERMHAPEVDAHGILEVKLDLIEWTPEPKPVKRAPTQTPGNSYFDTWDRAGSPYYTRDEKGNLVPLNPELSQTDLDARLLKLSFPDDPPKPSQEAKAIDPFVLKQQQRNKASIASYQKNPAAADQGAENLAPPPLALNVLTQGV